MAALSTVVFWELSSQLPGLRSIAYTEHLDLIPITNDCVVGLPIARTLTLCLTLLPTPPTGGQTCFVSDNLQCGARNGLCDRFWLCCIRSRPTPLSLTSWS